MIITKFSRFGQVVKNEDGEVIPGSFRFTAFLPDGKEVGFKAAQPQIAGAAISIEKSVFTDKTGKVVEFYKINVKKQQTNIFVTLIDNHHSCT